MSCRLAAETGAGQVVADHPQAERGLLYLQPTGHLNDLVVPVGALACANAAQVSAQLRRGALCQLHAWTCELDHSGPSFDAAVPPGAGVTHLALVPHLPGQDPQDLAWIQEVLAPDGLVALEVPRGTTAHLRCQGVLRLLEMRLALVRGDGQVVAQGRAELAYFTPVPPPRPKPASPHGPQQDHSAT